MVPLARPALASLAIFTFVLTWNDYLWPLVASTETPWFTVTTGLASLRSNFAATTNLGDLMARGLIGSMPLTACSLGLPLLAAAALSGCTGGTATVPSTNSRERPSSIESIWFRKVGVDQVLKQGDSAINAAVGG